MTIIVTTTGSNSARDYDWLKASVTGWLHRADLDAKVPDFVMLAEQRIKADLDAQLQDAIATLTTTAGESAVALPASVIAIKALSTPGRGPVDYLSPGQFNELYASGASGPPRHYTVIGNALYLGPTADRAYSLSAVARSTVPPLSDSGGTNWLIEQQANLYLAATMCEALTYTKDTAALQVWEGKYAGAINGLDSSDWNYAGTMAVRTAGPTP